MKEDRLLFLFTTGYPYGIIEDFLHTEIMVISKLYSRVVLFVPSHVSTLPKRELPENIDIILVKHCSRLAAIFHPEFWKIYYSDIINGQTSLFNLSKLKIAISYYSKSVEVLKAIKSELIKNKNKTITYYSYWFNESALAIATLKEKNKNNIAICRAHGWDLYRERHTPEYLPFRKWIGDRLNQVSCVSNFGLSYLRKTYSLPENKTFVHHLGTLELDTELEFSNNKIKLISCSNIIPIKRVQLIVEVLSMIDIPILWTHIGDGPGFENIKKLVDKNLNPNVEINFKGEVSNQEVRNLYSQEQFDLFISLSETEGLPVSMMEALSTGTPIIGTNVGGVSEIVITGKTGWLIEENNLHQMSVNAISSYYHLSTEEKLKLKKNCVNFWKENFNAISNYNNFINSIESYKSE